MVDTARSGVLLVGRESELAIIERVLDAGGPRICFVYGIAGIGKSSLLAHFGVRCEQRGMRVVRLDCRSTEPTEDGFFDAVARAVGGPSCSGVEALEKLATEGASVLLIDTYEVFRIAVPWLRHSLLPTLGASVRVVIAGREPPMLEWAIERGQLGGLEVLPLGPLDEAAVQSLLSEAGLLEGHMSTMSMTRLCGGHPLAIRLAIEARLAGGALPIADAMPAVVHALAAVFRDGLDVQSREVLDAAAIPRRITRPVLAAMLGEDRADDAVENLRGLAFVDTTADGLRLHEAVQLAVAERLRSIDPERFRKYRTAAWHHLQSETRAVARHELARSTADALFLIDNPVVREAFFPTTAHVHSVETCRPGDAEHVQSLWHSIESPEGAAVLDQWLERVPMSVRVVRDRSGSVVGCSIVATWRDIPQSLERVDPVLAAFASHAARCALPFGQSTVVLRRVLTIAGGEGPSNAQAAAWLDVKRDYFTLRPHLGRVYTTLINPTPFIEALIVLGFTTFGPVDVGTDSFHLAALDFGPDSVDGWLTRLGAAELGIAGRWVLNPDEHTIEFDGQRTHLSPLEFGVLQMLTQHKGHAVRRTDLLHQVWGREYVDGSNVVEAVIRSLRVKAGNDASRIETARGIGYRLV